MAKTEIIQIIGFVLTLTWLAGLTADFRTHQLHSNTLWLYIATGLILNAMMWGPFIWRAW